LPLGADDEPSKVNHLRRISSSAQWVGSHWRSQYYFHKKEPPLLLVEIPMMQDSN
jgi:hypothetical protein